MNDLAGDATLEVIEPATDRGARFHLMPAGSAVAGRDPAQQVVLTHPTVSRRHAEFCWRGADLIVNDLGSSSGTLVNGRRLSAPHRLEPGDQVSLGAVVLRYWPSAAGEPTELILAAPSPATRANGSSGWSAAPISVDAQYGHTINNVDGNQHFHYIQQQREPFLQQVAATRTKARWFIWLGVVVLVVGMAAFGRMVLQFLQAIYDAILNQSTEPDFRGIFDEKMFGLSVGLLGFAVGALGELMVIVGIVLHITATARRRRVDRDLPLPPTGR